MYSTINLIQGLVPRKLGLYRTPTHSTQNPKEFSDTFFSYPRLSFDPFALFGFGAPIGLLLALRGVENLGEEFRFQTCGKFLNIFHPVSK